MALYFAYGSNMLTRRLGARCGSARGLGPAVLAGHEIAFDKIGQDGSGKATLVAGSGAVQGVLFRLDDEDLLTLDAIEGVGRGYERVSVNVAFDGTGDEAFTYIAPDRYRDADMQPFDWYKALVLAGAREHGLPECWLSRLEAVPSVPDPEPGRLRRIEAIGLLNRCVAVPPAAGKG
ncbi:gamma-glutamylcyclotransferase family protein [Paracoccus aerodenitrificans]|uniref:gamma-glutamylcyclotransferase family protein n=1 Tax=Paracoccus aerodenitrificans TaxID=3017781 RepID=UPI0022F07E24|nr:gamma-glutamylcyclotransferase family protein [Paracoccus aerodenitrificans]WBU63106.1 gamma-glutamylcyclotransferase [Paracoccus aerodenitrificans]